MTLRITRLCHYGDFTLYLFMAVIMLSVIMLSVIMVSVIMLSVVMLSVVVPKIIARVEHLSLFWPGSMIKIKKFHNIDNWST
jgi:hypothetical protein